MSDQVLTDEQRRAAYGLHDDEPNGLSDRLARVERAVVAALAARGGVDVEAKVNNIARAIMRRDGLLIGSESIAFIADALRLALATAEARIIEAVKHEHDAWVGALQMWLASRDVRVTVCGGKQVAIDLPSLLDDVIALLTADAEARHAEREAMWKRLRYLEVDCVTHLDQDDVRELEGLRRALGLEG